MQAGSKGYASPFLSPEFAQAVGEVRADTSVAMVSQGGAPLGYWAFHRRPGGVLRPVGAPVSDWQGPVLSPGVQIDGAKLVRACGGHVVRFDGLADPDQRLNVEWRGVAASWLIDLSDGAAAYRNRLKVAQGKHLANTARCRRKAEREIGPVRFHYQDASREAYSQVFAWKKQQFRETRKYDVLSPAWIRNLFDVLWRWPRPEFGLVLCTVYFGDRLAAGEVFLRQGGQLHAWIAAYDRALAAYAPGHILSDLMMDVAPDHGVHTIDFGAGSDAYKSRWCLDSRAISQALVYGACTLSQTRAALRNGVRSLAVGPAKPLLTRVRGFTDHVFAAQANLLTGASSLATATVSQFRSSS